MDNTKKRLQILAGIIKENYEPMTAPSPNPDRETIERPTTAPEPRPKRRTLSLPTEAPDTKPKAIADKMASRFNKLQNGSQVDESVVGRFQELAGLKECDCEHDLDEIKIGTPATSETKIPPEKILTLPELNLTIGKYNVSKGRLGLAIPVNSKAISSQFRDRSNKVFEKLGIRPNKAWIGWIVQDNRVIGWKSTFIQGDYNGEPIMCIANNTADRAAGQFYVVSKYAKSGKVGRLPDPDEMNSNWRDYSKVEASSTATKEQLVDFFQLGDKEGLDELSLGRLKTRPFRKLKKLAHIK